MTTEIELWKQSLRAWWYIFTFRWKKAVRYLEDIQDGRDT